MDMDMESTDTAIVEHDRHFFSKVPVQDPSLEVGERDVRRVGQSEADESHAEQVPVGSCKPQGSLEVPHGLQVFLIADALVPSQSTFHAPFVLG